MCRRVWDSLRMCRCVGQLIILLRLHASALSISLPGNHSQFSNPTPSSSRFSSSRSRWFYNPQAHRQRSWQIAQCQPYWRQCKTATGIISGESWSKSWNGAPGAICQPERFLLSEILALGLTREDILWGVSGTSWRSFPLKNWRNVIMNQYL